MTRPVALLLAVLFSLAVLSQVSPMSADVQASPPKAADLQVARVTRSDLHRVLHRRCVVDYARPLDIRAALEGTVNFLVAEGDIVAKGQDIARFDQRPVRRKLTLTESQRENTRLRLSQAQGVMKQAHDRLWQLELEGMDRQVAAARAELAHGRKLSTRGELSQKRLDAMQTTLVELERRSAVHQQNRLIETLLDDQQVADLGLDLVRLDMEIEGLQETLARGLIQAPFDARIVQLPEGMGAGSTLQARAGIPLALLADPGQLAVRLKLTQGEADQVRHAVQISIEDEAGRVAPARLQRIARREIGSEWDKEAFEALATFDDPGSHWRPGDAARCAFSMLAARDALVVPIRALRTAAEGFVVTRRRDGVQQDVPIRTGLSQSPMIQVLSGLQPDDEVLW